MKLLMRIKRYDPEKDSKPYWASYSVEADPIDRLLDALNTIKWTQDGSLTYRRSCAHGVCGSDAMRINGRNRLACKVLARDVGERVTIEPMLGFPVIKDLVVDLDQFFAKYESIKPYLITYDSEPGTERLQSPEQRARYDEGTKCILCGACTSSCPSIWGNPDWVGPASIVNAHRFIQLHRCLPARYPCNRPDRTGQTRHRLQRTIRVQGTPCRSARCPRTFFPKALVRTH